MQTPLALRTRWLCKISINRIAARTPRTPSTPSPPPPLRTHCSRVSTRQQCSHPLPSHSMNIISTTPVISPPSTPIISPCRRGSSLDSRSSPRPCAIHVCPCCTCGILACGGIGYCPPAFCVCCCMYCAYAICCCCSGVMYCGGMPPPPPPRGMLAVWAGIWAWGTSSGESTVDSPSTPFSPGPAPVLGSGALRQAWEGGGGVSVWG